MKKVIDYATYQSWTYLIFEENDKIYEHSLFNSRGEFVADIKSMCYQLEQFYSNGKLCYRDNRGTEKWTMESTILNMTEGAKKNHDKFIRELEES